MLSFCLIAVRPGDHARLQEITRVVGILNSRRTLARSRPHPLRNHPVLLFNCRWGSQPIVQESAGANCDVRVRDESPTRGQALEANNGGASTEVVVRGADLVPELGPQSPVEAEDLDDDNTLAMVFDSSGDSVRSDADDTASDVAVQGSYSADAQEVNHKNQKEMLQNSKENNKVPHIVGEDDADDEEMYSKTHHYLVCTCEKKYTSQAEAAKGKAACDCSTNDRSSSLSSFLRRPSTHSTFTALQRWEYENGLPVDGVEDVRQWAREVGLAGENSGDEKKRRKLSCAINPPKYIHQEPLDLLYEDGEVADIPKSPVGSDNTYNLFHIESVIGRNDVVKIQGFIIATRKSWQTSEKRSL